MNTVSQMKPEPEGASPNREESLFDAALALPATQRAAYLDKACGQDAALRQRVEGLLAAYAKSEGFLEGTPSGTIRGAIPPRRKTGRHGGPL